MRYADDTITNEQEKVKMGEREIITHAMMEGWSPEDCYEMLLDILNDQFPLEDAQQTVLEAFEEAQS